MLIFRVDAWPWRSQGSFDKTRKEFNMSCVASFQKYVYSYNLSVLFRQNTCEFPPFSFYLAGSNRAGY